MSGINYQLCKYCNLMVDADKEHSCQAKLNYQKKRKSEYIKKMKQISRPLHTKRWKAIRKSIIIMDKGVCQRCLRKYGVYTSERLEVHHIKPRIEHPELIFEENNLITLCHTCNAQLGLNGLDFKWSPAENRKKSTMFFG